MKRKPWAVLVVLKHVYFCAQCGQNHHEAPPAEEKQRLACCGRYLRLCSNCVAARAADSDPGGETPWADPVCPCGKEGKPDAVRK